MSIKNLSKEQLSERLAALRCEYDSYKSLGLKLDMSRGKPGADQLDLANDILDPALLGDFKASNGFETRNYGILDGIPECKQLFAEILGVSTDNIIVFGNASLTIMYDYIAQCMLFGAGAEPWGKQDGIKFLCPVPGYDRHFSILEQFGIEMINVPTNENGPDMDMIDELIKDEKVKGIICVPMYSNPSGITYSDETVERFASLKPAAKDFRVIWDNAYCVHHIGDNHDSLLNIFEAAKKNGAEDYFIEVTSTSKISFPGAGVAALAASDANIASIKKRMNVQTIGYDKINQLRHARYFKNKAGIDAHMKKLGDMLKPKFDAVLDAFNKNFAGKDIASWTVPNGGYFISLDVIGGAKKTVALCKEAGVTLTGAGATFPYGNDPEDKNIRIAPTFPSRDELCKAVEILCLCVEITAIEKILAE